MCLAYTAYNKGYLAQIKLIMYILRMTLTFMNSFNMTKYVNNARIEVINIINKNSDLVYTSIYCLADNSGFDRYLLLPFFGCPSYIFVD